MMKLKLTDFKPERHDVTSAHSFCKVGKWAKRVSVISALDP